MTILTRRFILSGLIAAPAIISYDRLMPIKSYGDWVRIRDFSYPNKTLEFYLDMKNCLEKMVYEILSLQPIGYDILHKSPGYLDIQNNEKYASYYFDG